MGVKDAVAARFESICRERSITINELACRSGVTPSSVYSMLDPSRRNISIVLIKKLCDGLDLSLHQFFDGAEFDELEQEIQ
ncbi:MAG: helix-turn-helix transcriptional regulator [Oscillibacter sp.]|nr:helix-turn-helix transcriptional regulator [Oscillibacter sp.]MBQ4550510.1 helix-turn-helix transcriptional regulator [Oscillospiraceae bacterium]